MSAFCRVHGEMLVYCPAMMLWRCPEDVVCGTYVTDELLHRRKP